MWLYAFFFLLILLVVPLCVAAHSLILTNSQQNCYLKNQHPHTHTHIHTLFGVPGSRKNKRAIFAIDSPRHARFLLWWLLLLILVACWLFYLGWFLFSFLSFVRPVLACDPVRVELALRLLSNIHGYWNWQRKRFVQSFGWRGLQFYNWIVPFHNANNVEE